MDAITEPQVTNLFPDCAVIKLHIQAKPSSPTPPSGLRLFKTEVAAPANELDLSLTINFSGEQEIQIPGGARLGLPGGRASFGLRRGQLRFALLNCKLPLETTALLKPFKVSIEVEQQKTKSNEIQAAAALDNRSVGAKVAEGKAETVTVEVFQVKYTGGEDRPGWVFEAYGDRSILEGMLSKALLGTIQVDETPCELTANFTVRGEDIQITWGQIAWAKDISRNKRAVIERAIALRYIKPMVEAAPICQGRWTHG